MEEPADRADGRSIRAQRRREETRSAILQAARLVFRERGYHEAVVAEIVAKADVARGTFYLYFDNKPAVLNVLVQNFLEVIRKQVHRISTEPGAQPPIAQIRANFDRILKTIEHHEDVATIMFVGSVGMDEGSRAQIDAFWDRVAGMIEDALAVGEQLGVVRACDRPSTAVMALGAVRAALARLITERRAGDDSAPEKLLDELITFVLRGILQPQSGAR